MASEKVSQQLYLSVKEKLDNYRIPNNFPIEATPLLNKLISLIDGTHKKQFKVQQLAGGESLDAALRHEMSHILKDSNKLHMDLMVAREENQSLQHRLYKLQANRNSQSKELDKLSSLKSQREQELVEQLREVRYKYNELMDFLHEDPQVERQYIKRLMKHRHQPTNTTLGGHQEVLGNRSHENSGNSHHIQELQTKVRNRQAEILRLHNLLEYDGMNMNKVIKNFQDSLVKNKLKDADHKINYLELSIDKVKKENKNMKNNNGSKEALRIEVEKCHTIIENLKKENRQLKRNHKEQSFDVQKHSSEQDRKISKIKSQKHHVQKESDRKQQHNQQLQKKIYFLEKEGKQLREDLIHSNSKLLNKEHIVLEQAKKTEQLKIFYEYQIDTYKKKLHELEFEIHQLKIANKTLSQENEITRRESEIKTDSILNLEKIVNELLRKNSILSDNTLGTVDEALRKGDEFEARRKLIDLQQQLNYSLGNKLQLQADLKAIQIRFGVCIRENERMKLQLSHLRNEITVKETLTIRLSKQLEEVKYQLKRVQGQIIKLPG